MGQIAQSMRQGRALGLLTVAALATALVAPKAQAAPPAALSQASGEAELVLATGNLQEVSQKVSQFKQAALPPMMQMMMPPNPLAAMKQKVGIRQGLDDTGSMAITLGNLTQTMQGQGQPAIAIILPVSDYGQLATGLGGQAEGVSEVKVFGGEPGYLRDLGNGYAVLAEKKPVATNYQPGGDVARFTDPAGTLGNQALDAADAMLWVDMAALGPVLKKQVQTELDHERTMLKKQIDNGQQPPAALPAFEMGRDIVLTVLEDTEGAVAALDVSAEGVGLSAAVQHAAGSAIGDYISAGDGHAEALLDELPADDFLLAAGYDYTAFNIQQAINNAMAKLGPALKQQLGDEQWQPIEQLATQFAALAGQSQGEAGAWYLPSQQAMMQGGLMQYLAVGQVDDPDEYRAQMPAFIDSLKSALGVAKQQMPQGNAAPGGPMPKLPTFTYEAGAQTLNVDGQAIEADRFTMDMNIPQQQMAMMGPAGMMLGGGKQQSLIASRGNYLVTATDSGGSLLEAGLKQAGQGGGLGSSPALAKLKDKALPANPIATTYVSFSGIGKLANRFAPMMMGAQGQGQGQGQGQPKMFNVPKDLAPLAMGLGAQDDGLAFRLYVPAETTQFATLSGMKAFMQFQRGMGGGPGGPGGGQRGGGQPPLPPAN
jgi:hypothetical protein